MNRELDRENINYNAPADINGWRTVALGIGGIASVVVLGIALFLPAMREQALRAWLLGFIFWGGIGIGGLGILILQHLTGGAWGIVIRRIAEACFADSAGCRNLVRPDCSRRTDSFDLRVDDHSHRRNSDETSAVSE